MRTVKIGRWISRRKEREETAGRRHEQIEKERQDLRNGSNLPRERKRERRRKRKNRERKKEKEHWDRTWRTRKGKRESVTKKRTEKGKKEADREETKRRGERLPHCTLADAISLLSIRDSPCVLRQITRYYRFDPVFSHPQVLLMYMRMHSRTIPGTIPRFLKRAIIRENFPRKVVR